MILGIDEVGRGAWAGPMVVGAAVLGDARIDGLTDSKKLTKKRRETLAAEIRQKAAGVGLGWVSARTIDRIGLSAALKLAARRAVADVGCAYDEIVIDGTIRLVDGPDVTLLKKADLLIPAVSAASIVAKVARDDYMARLDAVVAGYGFTGHVGYGTAAHAAALAEHGVSPLHRTSFAPIAALIDGPDAAMRRPARTPTTKMIGDAAEDEAARYLEERGHTIVARNWRARTCEIDIVSRYGTTLQFTEVKYRRGQEQGGGTAAVTPAKVARMRHASDVYVAVTGAAGADRRLSVLSLTGTPPRVDDYIGSVG